MRKQISRPGLGLDSAVLWGWGDDFFLRPAGACLCDIVQISHLWSLLTPMMRYESQTRALCCLMLLRKGCLSETCRCIIPTPLSPLSTAAAPTAAARTSTSAGRSTSISSRHPHPHQLSCFIMMSAMIMTCAIGAAVSTGLIITAIIIIRKRLHFVEVVERL